MSNVFLKRALIAAIFLTSASGSEVKAAAAVRWGLASLVRLPATILNWTAEKIAPPAQPALSYAPAIAVKPEPIIIEVSTLELECTHCGHAHSIKGRKDLVTRADLSCRLCKSRCEPAKKPGAVKTDEIDEKNYETKYDTPSLELTLACTQCDKSCKSDSNVVMMNMKYDRDVVRGDYRRPNRNPEFLAFDRINCACHTFRLYHERCFDVMNASARLSPYSRSSICKKCRHPILRGNFFKIDVPAITKFDDFNDLGVLPYTGSVERFEVAPSSLIDRSHCYIPSYHEPRAILRGDYNSLRGSGSRFSERSTDSPTSSGRVPPEGQALVETKDSKEVVRAGDAHSYPTIASRDFFERPVMPVLPPMPPIEVHIPGPGSVTFVQDPSGRMHIGITPARPEIAPLDIEGINGMLLILLKGAAHTLSLPSAGIPLISDAFKYLVWLAKDLLSKENIAQLTGYLGRPCIVLPQKEFVLLMELAASCQNAERRMDISKIDKLLLNGPESLPFLVVDPIVDMKTFVYLTGLARLSIEEVVSYCAALSNSGGVLPKEHFASLVKRAALQAGSEISVKSRPDLVRVPLLVRTDSTPLVRSDSTSLVRSDSVTMALGD